MLIRKLFSNLFVPGFLGFMLLCSGPKVLSAYHEEIGADVQEVYAAALEVLKGYGIAEQDDSKLFIETDWVEARSERVKSLVFFKVRKSYLRRTKFKVSFKRWPRYTEIDIRADYKFKPSDSSASAPWRKLKPRFEDYGQERELFRKILSQIEFARRASSASS